MSENERIGTEFTLSYSPSKKSRFFLNTNLFNSENIGNFQGVNLDRSNFSWSSRLNAKTSLPGQIDFQLQGTYFGPRNTSLVKFRPLLFVSGALSKDILNNRVLYLLELETYLILNKENLLPEVEHLISLQP